MLYVPRKYVFRAVGYLPKPIKDRVIRAASVTASLSASCHITHEGKILQVRAEYRDWFGVVGGLLKRREAPADGAIREVLEETGLAVVITGEPAVFVDPMQRRTEFIYPAELAPGVNPGDAHAAAAEIAEVRWATPERVQSAEEDPKGFNRVLIECLAQGGGMRVSEVRDKS